MGKLNPMLKSALIAGFICATSLFASEAAASTLRLATPLLAPDSDNPYRGLSLPSAISSQAMFDPLVIVDSDGQVKPWLLTKWETDASRVWRLTLRADVKFSNGKPLTARDIVESVKHMQTPKGRTETVGSNLANVETAVEVSELEVDIYLKEPDPLFPWRIAIWRLPEAETWKVRRADPGAPPAANSGSFSMIEKGEAKSVYEPNPYAWNPPTVDELVVLHLPDQTARLQALNADAIDVGMQMGVGDKYVVESIGGTIVRRQTIRVMYMGFAKEHEGTHSAIEDPRVRQALNYGVNRQRISDLLLDGMARPTGQLVLPGAPGYVEEIAPYPHDPDKARALLAEAGYGDGLELSIRFSASGADDMLVYQQAAEDLRGIGVKLNLLSTNAAQMTRMLFNGDYQADMSGNFGRGLDSLGDYRYRSCLGRTGNYPAYFCDEVSLEYVRQAMQSTSLTELDALMQQVTRREYESPPGVFLWQGLMVDALSERITSAEDYGKYYDFIPLHLITMKDD